MLEMHKVLNGIENIDNFPGTMKSNFDDQLQN